MQDDFWGILQGQRVTRIVLCRKTMAFAESFDMEFSVKFILESTIEQKIAWSMFPDSISLFYIKRKTTLTTEKGLIIELQCVHDAYHVEKIPGVAFVRTNFNLQDALTKLKANSYLLKSLKHSRLCHLIKQGVIRAWPIQKSDQRKAGSVGGPRSISKKLVRTQLCWKATLLICATSTISLTTSSVLNRQITFRRLADASCTQTKHTSMYSSVQVLHIIVYLL